MKLKDLVAATARFGSKALCAPAFGSRICHLLLAWISLSLSLPGMAGEDYSGFSIPSDPVLPAREVHPSLWFGSNDLVALREKRFKDRYAGKLWREISGSKYLTMPIPTLPDRSAGKVEVHKYYGNMAKLAKYNGFMFLLSGPGGEKENYRKRCLDALLRAYDGVIYELDPRIKGGPVDEIYRGTWAQNFSAAYDWVQPSLAPSEDAAIRERLKKEARYLYDNLFSFVDERPHNHLSKPAWGLGSLSLALAEEPEASAWLRRALEASNRNTRLFFSSDGIYREGSHYYIFSLINFLPFLYHYRNVSGVNAFVEFKPAFEWPLLIRNGKGWMPAIEDSYIKPYPSQMVAAAFRGTPTRLHSAAPLSRILQWNFLHTDFTPFDHALEHTGFNFSGATWDFTMALDEYLTYDPDIPAVAPDISPTVFLDSGQSVFRNDWSYHKASHRYLLFQGVAEAENHQHADHLGFIIQAENQMMASDSGYSRRSYGEAIRKAWYITPEAHNVVTLDGRAPADAEKNRTPTSRFRIDTDFFDFEEKEAPYPGGGRLVRAVAFPNENYFVILDQVFAPRKSSLALFLHGGRGTLSGKGKHRIWTYSKDEYGPSAYLSAFILSEGAEIREKMGEVTYIKGDYKPYPYLDATIEARETPFMQILFPYGNPSLAPEVKDESNSDRLGSVLTWFEGIDILMSQLRPSPQSIAGAATDATFACVHLGKTGKVEWWAAREVRYLNFNKKELFHSSKPLAVAVNLKGENRVDASIVAAGRYALSLRTGMKKGPSGAVFRDKPVPFRFRDKRIEFELEGSGVLRILFSTVNGSH